MCDPVAEEPTQTPVAPQEAPELPNAVSGAGAPTPAPASAPNADGSDITLPSDESSVEGTPTSNSADASAEPLHVRIAVHLEAIFSLVREAGL